MSTLILGASSNPYRYSYKAAHRLLASGETPILIGGRKGEVFGLPIQIGKPTLKRVDTVTLYLGESRQEDYLDYLIKDIKPRRIIFNPGSENPKLAIRAKAAGIKTLNACTLVMLATGQY